MMLSGYPGKTYTKTDAQEAKANAELVLLFVDKLLSELDKAVIAFNTYWASH